MFLVMQPNYLNKTIVVLLLVNDSIFLNYVLTLPYQCILDIEGQQEQLTGNITTSRTAKYPF